LETTRLSPKGQISIPKSVREAHNWEPGTELVIEDVGDAILLRPARLFPLAKLENVAGCLAYQGPAKTLEEMEAAILEEAKRHAQ